MESPQKLKNCSHVAKLVMFFHEKKTRDMTCNRGHYITNPNNALLDLLEGKSLKIIIYIFIYIYIIWISIYISSPRIWVPLKNDPCLYNIAEKDDFHLSDAPMDARCTATHQMKSNRLHGNNEPSSESKIPHHLEDHPS